MNGRAARILATGLAATAAGALVALWVVKRQPANSLALTPTDQEPAPRTFPPGASRFDDEWTAMPHASAPPPQGADDYESISPESLSAAFLEGATGSNNDRDAHDAAAEADLHGFQIDSLDSLARSEEADPDPVDPDVFRVDPDES